MNGEELNFAEGSQSPNKEEDELSIRSLNSEEINFKLEEEFEQARIHDLIDAEFNKTYKERVLYMVFLLNFVSSVMVNIDHGSLPACTTEVKYKLKIENLGFGALGTIVYAGLTLGSLFGTKVYANSLYIKPILSVSLSFNAVCLVAFTLTPNFSTALFFRFLTGIF